MLGFECELHDLQTSWSLDYDQVIYLLKTSVSPLLKEMYECPGSNCYCKTHLSYVVCTIIGLTEAGKVLWTPYLLLLKLAAWKDRAWRCIALILKLLRLCSSSILMGSNWILEQIFMIRGRFFSIKSLKLGWRDSTLPYTVYPVYPTHYIWSREHCQK